MKKEVDVLIIGAGILGCFAARNLSRYRLDVAVIEKNEDVCTGITKANTGIIYPGYDQHPGTLKASLCVRAARNFEGLCKELDVPYKKRGLLMLSFGPRGDEVLEKKLKQSVENQVEDVRILGAEEVYAMEPGLCEGVRRALYSENTCVVNPWELGIAAFENARANGVSFYFKEEADKIERTEEGFRIPTKTGEFRAKKVLICAGFHADKLWESIYPPKVRLVPKKADYLVLDTCAGDRIRHIISAESEEKGEGMTLVPTVNGNILVGPTRRQDPDEPEWATDEKGLDKLVAKCRKLIPSMPMDALIRNFATSRPNPFQVDENGELSEESLKDFVILEEDGLFDLIGIKTPGITCANELGAYITEKIVDSFDVRPEENVSFDPVRKGIRKTAQADERELEKLCRESSDYAEIFCRCRQVSKAEILEAIRRGATTVDGIKRRTGAGMGRCQGGYCEERIVKLLSMELNKDVRTVTKDGEGSEIIGSAGL